MAQVRNLDEFLMALMPSASISALSIAYISNMYIFNTFNFFSSPLPSSSPTANYHFPVRPTEIIDVFLVCLPFILHIVVIGTLKDFKGLKLCHSLEFKLLSSYLLNTEENVVPYQGLIPANVTYLSYIPSLIFINHNGWFSISQICWTVFCRTFTHAVLFTCVQKWYSNMFPIIWPRPSNLAWTLAK